jgi:hypothetical protein
MNLEFDADGRQFEFFVTLSANTVTLSLFLCVLRASKLCIHCYGTHYFIRRYY